MGGEGFPKCVLAHVIIFAISWFEVSALGEFVPP